ncbi:MAG TPA: methylmalonate-semialdehyde dehydrogenase (CoA acylating), partial [Nakamurella multipartita]|nr:methylmalonate-semialdehyde dehydrogenase (CoA acylating) [Nakamurella multipartita]
MTTISDPEAVPAAAEQVRGTGGVLPHWKDGASFVGTSSRTAPVYDPATGQVTKQVALASEADADAVIASAA